MGTRGFWGFVHNDVERLTYNHFDSYPSGLGADLLTWARAQDWDKVRQRVIDLQVVDEQAEPSENERIRVADFTDSRVSTGTDWYSALRHCQGDPEMTLASGYMIDSHEFPLDSLFAEYGYVFNLDDGTFEVYRGFQKDVPKSGRWAGRPTAEENLLNHSKHVEWCRENGREPFYPETPDYKAVTLWRVWPLHDLPTMEEFDKALGEDSDPHSL